MANWFYLYFFFIPAFNDICSTFLRISKSHNEKYNEKVTAGNALSGLTFLWTNGQECTLKNLNDALPLYLQTLS